MPPSQAELEALAERALTFLDGEGQATAWWELRAEPHGPVMSLSERTQVAIAVPGGELVTDRLDDDGLRSAAAAAQLLAGRERPGREARLPDPEVGRGHDGYDPRIANLDAAAVARIAVELPFNGQWQAGAAKTAIASTRGVRAYEQRSFSAAELFGLGPGSQVWASIASPTLDLDLDAFVRDIREFAGEGRSSEPVAPGEYRVVLGPWAVASLLEMVAWKFGGLTAESRRPKLGTRVAASAINLSDSPRFARTLPRSYDAEGSPVKPVPLIQDGVAHRLVHDATSGTTTGHATQPGGLGFPRPQNLVLVGGGAASVAELARPIEDGFVITSIAPMGRAVGVRRIKDGELGEPVRDFAVKADAFEVLASTEALTSRQWLVPGIRGSQSARTASALVVPGLRARVIAS